MLDSPRSGEEGVPVNIAHLFARHAAPRAQQPALACGTRVVCDWRSLCERAARRAGGLLAGYGLVPGDRIGLFARNLPDYVEALLAAWWAGLVPVPINARLHPDELAWIMGHAGVRLLLVSDDLAAGAGAVAVPGLMDTLVLGGPAWERLLAAEAIEPAPVPPGQVAWLFYTSGTTGRPKGAMITHANIHAMVAAYAYDVDRPSAADAMVHAAPLSHGSGLYMLPMAAAGAVQVIPESGRFDPEEVVELWHHWRGVRLFAAPTMVRRLVRAVRASGRGPGHLATLVYGGAPMYRADLEEAHEVLGFRLAQIYGQGESPMTITAMDREMHRRCAGDPALAHRLESAGTPQLGCRVEVWDPEGRRLPPGEVGEIVVQAPTVVPGYWRDPAASRRTMGDGWLRTGDLGCFDEDGFLYIKDRAKDLVISGGANIYPREVEEVLLRHPAVREVAVVGLPDREWGEVVVACVVAAPGTTAEELERHCLAHMARYKRPRRWVFLPELPKSAYGKILKRELRAQLVASAEDGQQPGGEGTGRDQEPHR